MTRAQQTVSILLLLSSVRCPFLLYRYNSMAIFSLTLCRHSYTSLYTSGLSPPMKQSLIVLACFLGARLGYMILTFNDVPHEYESLQKEIEQAKTELRKANVDVD